MFEPIADLDEPPVVPRTFNQLGILVLDGSGSMTEVSAEKIQKAQAVDMAVKELLGRLKASRAAPNFSMAVVTFDTSAITHSPAMAVSEIDEYGDYNPLPGHGGGTDIGAALRQAQQVAQQFLNEATQESVPRSVVIVLMSDGMHQSGPDPVPVADQIKLGPQITICATLFAAAGSNSTESAAAEDLLRRLASSPVHYRTTYRAEDLRKFFIASVSSGKNVKIA